jgi:hypothetical protein
VICENYNIVDPDMKIDFLYFEFMLFILWNKCQIMWCLFYMYRRKRCASSSSGCLHMGSFWPSVTFLPPFIFFVQLKIFIWKKWRAMWTNSRSIAFLSPMCKSGIILRKSRGSTRI